MKNQLLTKKPLAVLAGVLMFVFALALSLSVVPAAASGVAQDQPTATPTVTATLAVTLTPTVTATATLPGTLPPPAVTGTPTQLVPVTGADLDSGGEIGVGVWVALWLIGLMLIAFGLKPRFDKR